MRIAIVIERFNPAGGGNERSTDQVARGLTARGHHVTILCNESKQAEAGPLTFDAANGPSTRSASGLRRFAAWAEERIENGGFDVSLSMVTAVAADVIEPRGGTVVETQARNIAIRGSVPARLFKMALNAMSPKQRMLLALERRALSHPRLHRIVAISGYVADQLEHHYRVPPDRITINPNAAEVGTYGDQERAAIRAAERQRLGIAESGTVFLYAAHNHKLKGLPAMLLALFQLVRRRADTFLVIAGPMERDPGWKRRGTTDLMGNVKLAGNVGRIDEPLLASDVLVHPTWYDPSSKVVLEALLLGRPAISTLHNGASQWIFDPTGKHVIPSAFDASSQGIITGPVSQAGRIIGSAGHIEALAEAMRQMCDPAERTRCVEAIEAAGLHERISMKAHVEALERVLMEVAGKKGDGMR